MLFLADRQIRGGLPTVASKPQLVTTVNVADGARAGIISVAARMDTGSGITPTAIETAFMPASDAPMPPAAFGLSADA